MKTKAKATVCTTAIPFLVLLLAVLSTQTTNANNTSAVTDFYGGRLRLAPTDNTFGWAFRVSSSIQVSGLGLWDYFSDGLADSHLVAIWTSTGQLVADGTVDNSGTFAPTAAWGFRFVAISPVYLVPGEYTIGAYYPGSGEFSPDLMGEGVETVLTAPTVTYLGGRSTSGFAFPPGDDAINDNEPKAYFGPNFIMPDSGGTVLLLFGSFPALALLRWHIGRVPRRRAEGVGTSSVALSAA